MISQSIQPGAAFQSSFVEDDVFVFWWPSSIIEGDGLFRRFNVTGGFFEPEWYRFKAGEKHLSRVGEWDFTHG